VEVPGVFISKDAVLDLRVLPPVLGRLVGDFLAEGSFGKGAEAPFKNREVSVFLETIRERDDCTAIEEINRR
jgi:hypothetical protein